MLAQKNNHKKLIYFTFAWQADKILTAQKKTTPDVFIDKLRSGDF
jgi:hypothetical protein